MIRTYPTLNAPDGLYAFGGVKLAAALSVERCPAERIAEHCGVSVSTVYRWRKRPDFQRMRYEFAIAYRKERRERLARAREEYRRRSQE